jgi:restriction system protein
VLDSERSKAGTCHLTVRNRTVAGGAVAAKKTIADRMLKAYQDHLKKQAAEQRRAEVEARSAAAQEQRRREAAERKAKQAAEAQARREDAAQARLVAAALRGLDQREARRERDAAQAKRAKEQAQEQAQRAAKAEQVQRLKNTSLALSSAVSETVAGFRSLLIARDRNLEHHRQSLDAVYAEHGATAFADAVGDVLGSSLNGIQGGDDAVRVAFAPESRELLLEIELPGRHVVPKEARFRYVPTRGEIVADSRKESELRQIYADLLARVALCAIDYAFAITPPALVDSIALSGYTHAKDPATGKSTHPLLMRIYPTREQFDELELDEPELQPIQSLRHLSALVSPHPYDLEAVHPTRHIDLSQYKLTDDMDVIAGLDSRTDLLTVSPTEFEHLVRELFVAMGFKGWNTVETRDDGIDAVVWNPEPMVGGECIIQAKRYSRPVPVESVRALAGSLHDKKNATKAILVTTSYFSAEGVAFADRSGRIELITGRHLKALLYEHLGADMRISLPKIPSSWRRNDIE